MLVPEVVFIRRVVVVRSGLVVWVFVVLDEDDDWGNLVSWRSGVASSELSDWIARRESEAFELAPWCWRRARFMASEEEALFWRNDWGVSEIAVEEEQDEGVADFENSISNFSGWIELELS